VLEPNAATAAGAQEGEQPGEFEEDSVSSSALRAVLQDRAPVEVKVTTVVEEVVEDPAVGARPPTGAAAGLQGMKQNFMKQHVAERTVISTAT